MKLNPLNMAVITTIAAITQIGVVPDTMAGGMTVGDLGTQAEGRAGAFAAKSDDLTAIEYNPAGLTLIGGTQFYLSNRFGYAIERFTRAPTRDADPEISTRDDGVRSGQLVTFDRVENGHPWQLLNPVIAAGSNFGLESWAFALGAYAPPGISVQEFPDDNGPNVMRKAGQKFMMIDRDVKILYYSLSVAWKYQDIFGVGGSLQWVDAASIKMSLMIDGNTYGVVNPVYSSSHMKSTITGADHFGVSGLLGVWYRPLPFLQFGLSGRAPTQIDADCDLKVEMTAPGFDVEPVITRNGRPANDVDLAFTLPATGRFGARYIHLQGEKPLFDVELDFVFEAWSMTDKYSLNARDLLTVVEGTSINVVVDKVDIPKKWKNTYSVRLGGDFNVLPERLILRAGGMYESPATRPEYASIDFFSNHRVGAALGASVKFYGVDISLSYNFVYEIPLSITEAEGKVYQQAPGTTCPAPGYNDPVECDLDFAGQPAATVNGGDYDSKYHFATLSASYTF